MKLLCSYLLVFVSFQPFIQDVTGTTYGMSNVDVFSVTSTHVQSSSMKRSRLDCAAECVANDQCVQFTAEKQPGEKNKWTCDLKIASGLPPVVPDLRDEYFSKGELSIPTHSVEAAFYHRGVEKYFLFKGDQVWQYDTEDFSAAPSATLTVTDILGGWNYGPIDDLYYRTSGNYIFVLSGTNVLLYTALDGVLEASQVNSVSWPLIGQDIQVRLGSKVPYNLDSGIERIGISPSRYYQWFIKDGEVYECSSDNKQGVSSSNFPISDWLGPSGVYIPSRVSAMVPIGADNIVLFEYKNYYIFNINGMAGDFVSSGTIGNL